MEKLLRGRPLSVRIPDDLPLVPIDGALIEQVLVNLLENAIKYAPQEATWFTSIAFDRGQQSRLFPAHKRAGTHPDFDVKRETGP